VDTSIAKKETKTILMVLSASTLVPHSFMFLWWVFQVCEVISKGFFWSFQSSSSTPSF
jgi:hypothetical protein